ncbi:3-carboxy-cis,cis-muconate cycloisomerase [Aquabacterium sp. A7-Y]|uniref:3-carboxy-cis,cis-muconate cycloisomerase n=1 Tax=Aquabacterium sp. A7-Y TaxID=1349605 RepID=UPI00223DCD80|nr:3-carboxy-cis,cis-muconate cycloisomerase [Aquabacterium sp. A7-Y]MCW7539023.1 3-carboxy-cis,cis-muconate cycloisomerase [Aquabacterium sp. A7-Y]
MSAFVFEGFLSTPEMLDIFSETSVVQAMMDFEAALAQAQAAEGLVPAAAAQTIAGVCKAELYDVGAIVGESGRAGSIAIPLVKKLTETVALFDKQAAGHVHWGSTSQDVIDTGLVLLTRRAVALLDRDLAALCAALLDLAEAHLDTPVLGRTLMQPAQVLSLGFKLTGWAAPLLRCRRRLGDAAARALSLQLGGAVGTVSAMSGCGPAVARRMAECLQLRLPPAAWHTQRDEWVALGVEVGLLCGVLGKLARDLSLLAQAEIGELAEPAGAERGGSSTMPHKRNPVASMVALAAALRAPHRVAALLAAMPQEHERGLGNWQAEIAEWAGLFISAHGALKALAEAAPGLQVAPQRMRENIDALQGLVFAEAVEMHWAASLGKAAAHTLMERLTQQALRERRHLREVALDALEREPELRGAGAGGAAELDGLFSIEAAAAPAAAIARQQLQALREQAAGFDAAPGV